MRETADLSYEENLEDARRLATMFWTVDECPKPVVARVRGAAMGGGAGLVAVADVAVAEEETRFAFPRCGSASRRPRSHRSSCARSGPRTPAPSSSRANASTPNGRGRSGSSTRSLPRDELDTAVEEKVGELLQGGPDAQADG